MYREGMIREAVDRTSSGVAAFLTGVYYWMTFALGISALCAWAVGTTPALRNLVFQNPENQFIKNTVYEELMFSLKRVRISQEEKERRVQEMLERFHLAQEKEKSPFVLSQGQKRRLSVADMLLTNQEILFLDEPTYGQDFENRQELMKDMQKLVEEGITIVMITHDLSLVRQYATRVVELEDGKVRKDLPTEAYFAWRREETGKEEQ